MTAVPKGYKQTEVGVIPDDWEVAVVGDAFEIRNQLRLPLSQTVREHMAGSYPSRSQYSETVSFRSACVAAKIFRLFVEGGQPGPGKPLGGAIGCVFRGKEITHSD